MEEVEVVQVDVVDVDVVGAWQRPIECLVFSWFSGRMRQLEFRNLEI